MAEESSSTSSARGSRATGKNRDRLLPPNCKKISEMLQQKKPTTKFKADREGERSQQVDLESCAKSLGKLQIFTKESRELKSLERLSKKIVTEIQQKKAVNSQQVKKKAMVHENDVQNNKDHTPKQEKKKPPKKQKNDKRLPEAQRDDDEQKNGKKSTKRKQVKEAAANEDTSTIDKSIKKGNTTERRKATKEKDTFPEHIPVPEMKRILQNSQEDDREFVEGHIRINPRFYKHAYISMPDQQFDLMISGLRSRNRAFDGDLVVAYINPPEKWHTLTGGEKRKTGTVICILEKVHSRKAVGHLKKTDKSVMLYPRDQRVPLILIHPENLPTSFDVETEELKDTLFLATIINWKKPQIAIGKIERILGENGNLTVESNAILLEHGLDVTPYSTEMTEDLPPADYVPTEIDMKDREDWRNECVFTIDPATAVDLDDAVSCKLLDNGNYEIGVHISDVTHYLNFLSPLDIQVAKRATTVYMTDNVYHMLPKQLCQVCSLLPGQDKLAFSVIWEMTPSAEVVKWRFAKTVIRSCCQMSYEHAQSFIESQQTDWPDDFLDVKGNFPLPNLSKVVNNLNQLAVQMRNKRFADGALKFDLPKLYVITDKTTGLPMSYGVEERKDSNWLIEEFMLLANMTVATHLFDTIPDTALLRQHKEPSKHVLSATKDCLQKFGVHLDVETASGLHASIARYESEAGTESEEAKLITQYRMMVINRLCSKAMTRALYTCSSSILSEDELWHYALNVPLYTHFTSPIRRYVDCVVHRLLHSTLQNVSLPEKWSSKLCTKIAANCNAKKYSAKLAQEQSSELYFTYLIDLTGPVIAVAIVLDVKEQSIDVILCHVGLKLRIYFSDMEDTAAVQYSTESTVQTITVTWKDPQVTQVINIFTLLHVKVFKHPELFRLTGILLPP